MSLAPAPVSTVHSNLPLSDPITLLSTPLTCGTTGNPNANTGLSIWFGARNLVNCLPAFLSSSGPPIGPVLELGAGAGLTGIWLSGQLPGVNLCLTDGVDEVIPLLQENVSRNCAVNAPKVERLLWGARLSQQYR